MVSVVVAFAAVLAAFVLSFVVVSYERELRSMARFLAECEQGSNERISVEFSTRGISGIAKAVNAELDAQRDARIERDRREEAFRQDLASLSHDIRTPLAGAQGYLQLCERASSDIERARCLAAAQDRLAAMRALTDDLFEYAKASDPQSPLSAGPVCLFSAVADVLAGMYPQFVEKGWTPKLDFESETACVSADAESLARVFQRALERSSSRRCRAAHRPARLDGHDIESRRRCDLDRTRVSVRSILSCRHIACGRRVGTRACHRGAAVRAHGRIGFRAPRRRRLVYRAAFRPDLSAASLRGAGPVFLPRTFCALSLLLKSVTIV